MNGWTLRRSLRWRILLSASAGLILLLAVMALQGAQVVASLTSQQMIEWSNTAEHSAKHLQARIEQDQALLEQLAAELVYMAGKPGPAASGFLANTQDRLEFFRHGLVWLNPEGEVIAWEPGQQPVKALLPDGLSAALPSPGSGRRLSNLLYTGEGRPVVAYSIRLDQLGTLLAIADLSSGLPDDFLPRTAMGGHAALLDSQGWVLAATRGDLRFTRREHPDWVVSVLREGRRSVAVTNGQGQADERDIMAFAPVGTTGWGLVLGEPIGEALAASFQMRRRMLLLGLAALALVVSYAWWDTGAITRPLQRLTSLAERIAAGDLSTPVTVQRHDEIGMLARTFEAMRLSLRSSREKLENALLETRRRERETVALYAVTQEILRSAGSGGALRTVVERVRELLRGSAGAICLAESPDSLLRCVAATVTIDDGTPGTGRTCVAPHQAPASPLCPLLRHQGHQQVFVEQVAREGAARGYLCLAAGPGYSISEQDRTLLAGLANLAGLALVHEQLQAQSRTLAVYAERERISRELHDSVSQSLSYLYSQLELLQEILPKLSTEQLRAELSSLSGVASIAFEEARDSIFSLRIAGGGDPLPIVIGGCVRDFKARTGIPVELDADVMASTSLAPEAEIQLVHIVQEALSNVAKHARATRVVVRAEVQGSELRVTIQDNGEGFDPGAPRPGHRSFGLEMMRERAESVGGNLEIHSSRDHGTRILVGVPLGG